MKKNTFLLSLILLVLFTFYGCGGNPSQTAPSDIAAKVIDSVVTVFVDNEQTDAQVSMGSGVCIRDGGYIVTNYHVIYSALSNDNLSISIYLNGQKSTGYDAEILWSNSNLDVAILKCEKNDIPYVKAIDRVINNQNKLRLLEPVIAIGTPIDFAYQNSCTYGYVSGLDRYTLSARSGLLSQNVYEDLIQHTASISNGNSGGGLFDLNGNLIGLNTLGSDSGNEMYFAVPIYPVLLVLDKVIENYNTNQQYVLPTIGISVIDSTICDIYNYDYINHNGLYVTLVENNDGNFQVGDVIISISHDVFTYKIDCRNDLIYALMQLSSGQQVTVNLYRNNVVQSVNIVLN